MRGFFLLSVLLSAAGAQAQLPLLLNNDYSFPFTQEHPGQDTRPLGKKWQWTTYKSISAGYGWMGRQSYSILSAPVGVQLNRRLSNNLFAFAGLSAAPLFMQLGGVPGSSLMYKNNPAINMFNSNRSGLYSSVNMGLMYINPEKTFSVSGSIHVDRGYYPSYNNRNSAISRESYHLQQENY